MMLTGEHNTIQYVAGNVSAGFHTKDLSYDLGITTAHGSLDANITGMALAVNIDLEWMLLDNGRYTPSIHSDASNVVIPDGGLKIAIEGGALATFISYLEPLFMGIIHNEVVSQVNNALKNSVPYDVNAMIVQQGGMIEVYNNMDFDYNFSNPPVLNADGL